MCSCSRRPHRQMEGGPTAGLSSGRRGQVVLVGGGCSRGVIRGCGGACGGGAALTRTTSLYISARPGPSLPFRRSAATRTGAGDNYTGIRSELEAIESTAECRIVLLLATITRTTRLYIHGPSVPFHRFTPALDRRYRRNRRSTRKKRTRESWPGRVGRMTA